MFKAGIVNAGGHPFRQVQCGELRSDRWPRDTFVAADKTDKKWECSRGKASSPVSAGLVRSVSHEKERQPKLMARVRHLAGTKSLRHGTLRGFA